MRTLLKGLAVAAMLCPTAAGAQDAFGFWGNSTIIRSAATLGTDLYVGTGSPTIAEPAKVWRYDGVQWLTQRVFGAHNQVLELYANDAAGILYASVLRNGVATPRVDARLPDGSWLTLPLSGIVNAEVISAMVLYDGGFYAGVANETNDNEASVYLWQGFNASPNWLEVGGKGQNGSWDLDYNGVYDLFVSGGLLYATMSGGDAGDGDVWTYDGTTWTQIGGNGIAGSWSDPDVTAITAITEHGGDIVVGLQRGAAAVDLIWTYDGATWSALADDAAWSTATIAAAAASHSGDLYVGIGGPTDDGFADVYSRGVGVWVDEGRPCNAITPPAGATEIIANLITVGADLVATVGGSYLPAAQAWMYATP